MTNHDDSNPAGPKASILPYSKFNPDAYGKPSRLRGGVRGRTSRQGSTAYSAPFKNLSTPDNGMKSPNGDHKLSTSPRRESGVTNAALSSPVVPPEDMRLTNPVTGTMNQDRSSFDQKGDSEYTTPGKGRQWMEENVKPCNAQAAHTTTATQNEKKLKRLQEEEMRKLGHKIRQQSSEPTTSPQALRLARQASKNFHAAEAAPETSRTTKTTRNVMSPRITPHMDGDDDGTAQQEGSNIQGISQESQRPPKDRSVRSPTISTRGKWVSRLNNSRKGRWATSAESKAPPAPAKSIDSNAFGSQAPSDAETASGDSIAPMDNGRLLRKNRPAVTDAPLADWSGNWMPPPIDWDGRPPFDYNSADFVGDFGQWNETTTIRSLNVATGIPFTRLSRDLVENPDLHPDGLNLVDPTMSVDVDTAERYGYSDEVLDIIKKDAHLIDPDIFILDWGKLDPKDPENVKFQHERCKDLVANYNANLAKMRNEEISLRRAQQLARRREVPISPTPNLHTPRINIYLRPAVRSDIPQLQEIYNSYVINSVRTAEIHPITYSDMLARWTDSTDEKLPFVVAVSKSAKINRGAGNRIEKIVGWASATDWVSRHAVERFTVELEIYVHQQHLHQGIGKCLMDKLIDSTDRGYIARKGYPFTCAPELRHGYSAGGARDLIKLLILVRSLDKPQNIKEKDLPWIKKWLEDEWNFEQQGYFPKTGVKFRRYVNETYFVRSTSYNPKELLIPEEAQ